MIAADRQEKIVALLVDAEAALLALVVVPVLDYAAVPVLPVAELRPGSYPAEQIF